MNHGWLIALFAAASLSIIPAQARAQATPPPPPESASPVEASMMMPMPEAGSCPHACPCMNGHHRCAGHVIRLATTATALLTLGAAIAFQVYASQEGSQIDMLYNERDPNHSMPVNSYTDLSALNADRGRLEAAAVGFFVAGGIFTLASTFMWLAPHGHHHCCHHRPAPPVAFGVSPTSMALTFRF